MDKDFWERAWENDRTGFHSDQTNPFLMKFWGGFEIPAGATVLVPLAGKSVDMIWLAEQGYRVLGVELSEIAVKAFFDENGLPPTVIQDGPFTRWEAGEIAILCGDFFALTAEHAGSVAGVYDRAAMVALPLAMRQRYAAKMGEILPAGCQTFLVTFEYDQAEMSGPPFSVVEAEVRQVYQDAFSIDVLTSRDVLAKSGPNFQRALSRFDMVMYRLGRVG